MTGKRWMVAVGVAVSLVGSGCVSCGHQVCKPVLDAGPTCEIQHVDKQHVYLLLINGATPSVSSGLDGLRDKLAERGFEKAYSGQLCHVWWMWLEMKRIHADDPSARFVVVGYDFGCGPAARLARDAVAKGIPVDAVVLLDPVGQPEMGGCPAKTVLVHCGAAVPVAHTEAVSVVGANHFLLPADSQTVETVFGLLKECAAKVEHPPVVENAMTWYEGASPPRSLTVPAGDARDWLFLHDQPGPHAVPLSPPATSCPPAGDVIPQLPFEPTPALLGQPRLLTPGR